jgi:hypothetical protein
MHAPHPDDDNNNNNEATHQVGVLVEEGGVHHEGEHLPDVRHGGLRQALRVACGRISAGGWVDGWEG